MVDILSRRIGAGLLLCRLEPIVNLRITCALPQCLGRTGPQHLRVELLDYFGVGLPIRLPRRFVFLDRLPDVAEILKRFSSIVIGAGLKRARTLFELLLGINHCQALALDA